MWLESVIQMLWLPPRQFFWPLRRCILSLTSHPRTSVSSSPTSVSFAIFGNRTLARVHVDAREICFILIVWLDIWPRACLFFSSCLPSSPRDYYPQTQRHWPLTTFLQSASLNTAAPASPQLLAYQRKVYSSPLMWRFAHGSRRNLLSKLANKLTRSFSADFGECARDLVSGVLLADPFFLPW